MTGQVVGSEPWGDSPIVVGVDGSPTGAAALRYAAERAILEHAGLSVVMAWEPVERAPWQPEPVGDEALENRLILRREIQDVLSERPEVDFQAACVRGRAVPVLLDAAHDASILVLGCRGRGGFEGQRLGSVALYCTMYAPCTVVIVREGGEDLE
jgi:nucleotide-binding universal stress UspA family protein